VFYRRTGCIFLGVPQDVRLGVAVFVCIVLLVMSRASAVIPAAPS